MIIVHSRMPRDQALALPQGRMIKVNLRKSAFANTGEGIWAYPTHGRHWEDARDDNSHGVEIRVFLCNDPYCTDVQYGDEITCITNGRDRPYSKEVMSPAAVAALNAVAYNLTHTDTAGSS